MDCSFSHDLPEHASGLIAAQAPSLDYLERKWHFLLVVALFSFIFAIFVAPEEPRQYASICQKHNSSHACQIW